MLTLDLFPQHSCREEKIPIIIIINIIKSAPPNLSTEEQPT